MDEKNITSFWKKNIKTIPGSPKRCNKQSSKGKLHTGNSYQNFQASVSDVWNIDDDDFCIISEFQNTKISRRVSQYAVINMLKIHKKSVSDIKVANSITNDNSVEKRIKSRIPGKPQKLYCLNPPQQEDTELKLAKFDALLNNSPTLQELCNISWSGIPIKVKAITWKLLSGYLPINLERRNAVLERKRDDYWSLVKKYYYSDYDTASRDTLHQIKKDMPRMNPSIQLFQQKTVQLMLERILFIWSVRHPASGYVQGMNDLATPFYVVFLQEYLSDHERFETFKVDNLTQDQLKIIEADSFWCLSKLLESIQDNYVFGQVGIQEKISQLEDLIKRIDEMLHNYLKQHDVSYLQFSFRWLNNLLTRELPLRCIIRLWDTYLAENDCFATFQLYVCAAFLLHWKDDLMRERDFSGLLLLLQNLPTQSWNSSHISLLVAEAYKLKVMFADSPNHLGLTKTSKS